MAIAVTIIAAVVLTAVALAVARAGNQRHQEDLSDHHAGSTEPKADRPAGPGAEPMGVADAGEPSIDPTTEQRR